MGFLFIAVKTCGEYREISSIKFPEKCLQNGHAMLKSLLCQGEMCWRSDSLKFKALTSIIIVLSVALLFLYNTLAVKYYGDTSIYHVGIQPKETSISFVFGSDSSVTTPVVLSNHTRMALTSQNNIFLTYHLLDSQNNMISRDNKRTNIDVLNPYASETVQMIIDGSIEPGDYILEIDLVEEQVAWFSDMGNPIALVSLHVE